MSMRVIIFLILIVFSVTVIANQMTALDSLEISSRQGWGVMGVNEAAHAKGAEALELQIKDRKYQQGFGTHANSGISIELYGEYVSFEAKVGVQWQGGNTPGSVIFQVYVDNEKMFDSGRMREKDAAAAVKVSLKGGNLLRLVVMDAGNGITNDAANWCDVKLVRDANAKGHVSNSYIDKVISGSLAKKEIAGAKEIKLGDGELETVIVYSNNDIYERGFVSNGKEIKSLYGIAWAVKLGNNNAALPFGSNIKLVKKTEKEVNFKGENDLFGWVLSYKVSGEGRITKSLDLKAKKDVLLKQISLWATRSLDAPYVARGRLVDIAAFYRDGKSGIFASLDFPYSDITTTKDITKISYPPYEQLKAGESYSCHSLTYGATRIKGKKRYGHDVGEVEAMDRYIQERFEPYFERPMFVTSSIVNRYTQVEGDIIYYTMKDQPTLRYNSELLKRDVDILSSIDFDYLHIFPGVFDWVEGDPADKVVRDYVQYANSKGVHTGDYSGTNSVFCPHYNHYRNSLDKPQWKTTDAAGKENGFCFGEEKFVDYYIDKVVSNIKKYGFEVHCLDFLNIGPCYNSLHKHPAGRESVYHQVKGFVKLLDAIHATSPNMMTWSNSGNWGDFLPKIAWYNSNLYLTDPFIDTPWKGLNQTRLLDDKRREQMVNLHYEKFIPYRYLSNCQYFFCQNSIVPDIRNYQYGMLSTIAVCPNLGLAEFIPWLNSLCPDDQKEVLAFYKKWIGFLNENYDILKNTWQAGDNPGFGGVEIYSHTDKDNGYVFIVNPQYWDRRVEIPIDGTLGFDAQGEYEIEELYPVERLRLSNDGIFACGGSKLALNVPAQEVIVLELRPAPKKIKEARLYGLGGTIEKSQQGYLIKTAGLQGDVEKFAVALPWGKKINEASVRMDVPKQPKRQTYKTDLDIVARDNNITYMKVKFRREAVPTSLSYWKVKAADYKTGIGVKWNKALPDGEMVEFPVFTDLKDDVFEFPIDDSQAKKAGLGPIANFCGAYIDNAFGEQQPTWIDLKVINAKNVKISSVVKGARGDGVKPAVKRSLPEIAKNQQKSWWFETEFSLPFIYGYGCEPTFEEHTILVLPLFRNEQVKNIKAWINGSPLEVRQYRYPRNRALLCHWADLVGSAARHGQNTLIIYMESD